jgi:hypothetical protein
MKPLKIPMPDFSLSNITATARVFIGADACLLAIG